MYVRKLTHFLFHLYRGLLQNNFGFLQPLALICKACGAQKPKAIGSKSKTWSCKFCTLENSTKQDKCTACCQWRYSYGPPVSTHGPNYGT